MRCRSLELSRATFSRTSSTLLKMGNNPPSISEQFLPSSFLPISLLQVSLSCSLLERRSLFVGTELPFLQGRSFVFASQFAGALPAALATQYIDAAITVVDSTTASVPVKISAVRALNKSVSTQLLFRLVSRLIRLLSFFRHLSQNIDATRATSTMRKLLVLLPLTTDNTMVLIVETLDATLKVGGTSLNEEECRAVVEGVLQCWFATPEGQF